MLCLAPAICFAALDTEGLLRRLARPAPATTPFVEVRFSKLLDQPIVVKGQLEYHEDGTLVRAVSVPFRERTEIRGETVTVERVGRSQRRFSLKRAPELRSMLGGFAAVLGGGQDTLERDFTLALADEEDQWKLALTPKSASVGKYVRDIVIEGHASEPRCIIVTQPDTQSSVMLVGKAAEATLPTPLEREWLDRFCDSGGS
jgi:Outer membrane lipoprotein carrier protein LolA-like